MNYYANLLETYSPYIFALIAAAFGRKFAPEQARKISALISTDKLAAINYTLLFVGFTAHVFALRFFGILTGTLFVFGIGYAIEAQRNAATPTARRYALFGGAFLKIVQAWMEWTLLFSLISMIPNFPFFGPEFWTWTTLFSLLILDVGALIVKSAETADLAAKQAENEAQKKAEKAAQQEIEAKRKIEAEKLAIEKEEAERRDERKRADAERWAKIEAERQQREFDLKKLEIQAQERSDERKAQLEREAREAEEKRKKAELQAQEEIENKRKSEAEKAEKEKRKKAENRSGKRNPNWREDLAEILAQIRTENQPMPTQKQLAEMVGASDRSVRDFLNNS